MKKTLRNIFLVTVLSPFLVQCASQDEIKNLQFQLRVVNKKIEDMKATTVGDIQKRQALSSSQIDQLEREILSLKSQLDETHHINQRLKEQNKDLANQFSAVTREEAAKREEALLKITEAQHAKEVQLAELSEKLKIQQESVQAIQDARVRDAERRAKEAKLRAETAKAKAQAASSRLRHSQSGVIRIVADKKKIVFPQAARSTGNSQVSKTISRPEPTPVTTATTDVPVASAESVSPSTTLSSTSGAPLDQAQQLYGKKQYPKAFAAFESFITLHPGGDDAIEARYMMGECLFEQKEYNGAILQYQKIISRHGSHPKAASATLRQGMAFELLADNETAKLIYKKVVTQYSSSPEASVAQEKLDKM